MMLLMPWQSLFVILLRILLFLVKNEERTSLIAFKKTDKKAKICNSFPIFNDDSSFNPISQGKIPIHNGFYFWYFNLSIFNFCSYRGYKGNRVADIIYFTNGILYQYFAFLFPFTRPLADKITICGFLWHFNLRYFLI